MPEHQLPDHTGHTDGQLQNTGVTYERTDAGYRGVFAVGLATLLAGAVVFAGIWWLFWGLAAHESAIKESPYPLAPEPQMRLPAEPRLEQLDRMAGIEKPNVFLREKSKEEILHSTGPTSEQGFVHIPIEKAMEMLHNQLPVRKTEAQSGPAKDNGLLDSGGPNSGRLYREGSP